MYGRSTRRDTVVVTVWHCPKNSGPNVKKLRKRRETYGSSLDNVLFKQKPLQFVLFNLKRWVEVGIKPATFYGVLKLKHVSWLLVSCGNTAVKKVIWIVNAVFYFLHGEIKTGPKPFCKLGKDEQPVKPIYIKNRCGVFPSTYIWIIQGMVQV